MGQTFYNENNVVFRRNLRLNMTPAEVVLWNHLKGKQFMGLKFRRQAGIGVYIVDFYCSRAKFVLEVDGDVHATEGAQVHDQGRNEYLKSLGLKVLRVTNSDVMGNIDGVGQAIADVLK